MKFRSVVGFTILAYTLSSPPFAAAITQLALSPFSQTTPDPDPAHASASDAIQSMIETGRRFPPLPVRVSTRESFFAEPEGPFDLGIPAETRESRAGRAVEFEPSVADSTATPEAGRDDGESR